VVDETPTRPAEDVSARPTLLGAGELEELRAHEYAFAMRGEPNHSKLCELRGTVLNRGKEYDVNILLDSGASEQYISHELVRKAALEVEDLTETKWVQVADGSYVETQGYASVTLVINGYRTRVTVKILNLPEFDMILGFDWLRTTNPIIN